MRIGIEAQRLFRKKKHGMDMVVLELIRNLQEIDKENEYVIFVSPDVDDQVIRETPNFKIIRLAGGFYPLWEQLALPMAAKKAGCQLLHCTSNTAPLFSPVPLMVTLHDIIYMESSYRKLFRGSSTLYQKFGNAYRKYVVPRILNKSRKIITVSHFERQRIAEFFKMTGDNRLEAVYNGVSSHFRVIADEQELKRVREKYKLPGHYFFFLGNTDPKKNTPNTLKAYSAYVKQHGKEVKFVMLDYERTELEKILTAINDPELIDQIILTGYVVNTDLPAIYAQAELFLYTSLRESFGIPMLEAMASGTPVITSNTSSMPEVAGNAAMLTDPSDPDDILAAMNKITGNKLLRNDLIEKGLLRATHFSWKAMATNVLAIYQGLDK
jgi:glycosyltransferase involved in cell wall biosynthesis